MKELDSILKELYAQCNNKRVDESTDLCISYLKHLESGYHIIGTNYSYILETTHNRKSFIFCLLNAIKGFEEDYQITPGELHLIIESLCPEFPKSLLTEAMITAAEQYNANTLNPENTYPISVLSRAVICHILYDEWLKALEETFRTEGKAFVLSATKIKSRCEQCYRNLPKSCPQPPYATIQAMCDEAVKTGNELSFERFKKTVFGSEAVQCEMRLLANYPSLI